jgi:hypothetical protein
MSKLILAVTASQSPSGVRDSANRTIVVESDKILVLPDSANTKAIIQTLGWTFWVDAEVAELASAMSATDASAYT